MKAIYLIPFISIMTIMTFIVGVLTHLSDANSQTPSTSDLPATIGNESPSNMDLTNKTIPAQNTSSIYAPPP